MFKAYGDYWKNYFNFSGRTRRKDFWLAVLMNVIISTVISLILTKTGSTGQVDPNTGMAVLTPWASAVSGLWSIANLIPGISLFTRRMHDTGKRFWYFLWMLLPLVGWIIVLVRELKAGDVGVNKFGPDPKSATAIAQQ